MEKYGLWFSAGESGSSGMENFPRFLAESERHLRWMDRKVDGEKWRVEWEGML